MFHPTYLEAGLLVAAAVAAVPLRYRLRSRSLQRHEYPRLRHLNPPNSRLEPPKKPEPAKKEELPKSQPPNKEEPKKGGAEPQTAAIAPRAVVGQFNYLTNCSWGPGQFWGEITLAQDIPPSATGSEIFVLPVEGIGPFDRLANLRLTFFGLTLPPSWTLAQFSDYQRTTGASMLYVAGAVPGAMYPMSFSLLAPDAASPAQVRLIANGPPVDYGGKPWPAGTRILIFSLTGI